MAEKEYIEREALKSKLKNMEATSPNKAYQNAMEDMIYYFIPKRIDEIPTADVAPVRHGHIIWKRRRRGGFRHVKCLHRFCNFVIEDNAPCKHIAKIDERYTTDEPYCSECGKLLGNFLNYCGNCGAKMGGDKND